MPITPEMLAKSGSEHGAQSALFCWAASAETRVKYPQLKWLYAVPNGFFGSAGQKAKMKAEGLKSGVPDICLPIAKKLIWSEQLIQLTEKEANDLHINSYGQWVKEIHGLYIELKIGTNKPSEEQKEWIKHLTSQGYACYVAYGWEDARDMIVNYLEELN